MTTNINILFPIIIDDALPSNPLTGDGDSLFSLLETAQNSVRERLRDFAQSPDFAAKMELAFGQGIDVSELQDAWAMGEVGFPTIEMRSRADINGANGAYAAATDTIYLSSEFLSQNAGNLDAITAVLLEEFGHSLDARLNQQDTAGDEGAIFSALVLGEKLSPQQLQQLKAEDDTVTIILDGQTFQVEQNGETPPPPDELSQIQYFKPIAGKLFSGETLTGGFSEQAIGDVDSDGIADLVTVYGSNAIAFWLGLGDGTFRQGKTLTLTHSSQQIAIADLNGDGNLDLITSDLRDVFIALSSGNQTFAPERLISYPDWTFDLVVGDFNGDGWVDLATFSGSTSNNHFVFLNDQNGNFPTTPSYQWSSGTGTSGTGTIAAGNWDGTGRTALATTDTSTREIKVFQLQADGTPKVLTYKDSVFVPYHAAIADFNRDGIGDIAVATGSSVLVLLGNSDETFSRTVLTLSNLAAGRVVTADFNHDGRSDLAVQDVANRQIAFLIGQGNGNFVEQSARYTYNLGTFSFADLNLDNNLDLVTTGNSSFTTAFMGVGDGTFIAPETYWAGRIPISVAVGNLDGTGDLDIVTANSYGLQYSLSVLLNQDGTYAPRVTYPVGRNPRDVVLADFNQDGFDDIANVNTNDGTISLLLNQGNGTFAPQQTYAVGPYPFNLAVGFFNNDRIPDLAVTTNNGNIALLLGDGSGSFTPFLEINTAATTSPYAITAGDLNQDGLDDVVLSHASNSNLSVLLSRGDGTFAVQSPLFLGLGIQPLSLALGDLNEDGWLDVAAATQSNALLVQLGQGDGTFIAGATTPLGTSGSGVDIALADFNGDRHLDVVSTNGDQNTLNILAGDGTGRFILGPKIIGNQPRAVAVADVNRDGAADIVTTNTTANWSSGEQISVYFNQKPVWHSPYDEVVAPVSAVRVYFPGTMNPDSFSLSEDVVSFSGPNGAIIPQNSRWLLDGRTLEIGFAPQSAIGDYQLVIGPNIADTNGKLLDLDRDGLAGESSDDRYKASFAITPPRYSGTIAQDTVWDGIVIVDGMVTVALGSTLTITPGTIVKFATAGRGTIVVNGELDLLGTVAEAVTFTSLKDDSIGGDINRDGNSTAPAAGDWEQIRVTGTGKAFIDHARIRYGGSPRYESLAGMVRADTGGEIVLSNTILEESLREGILAWYDSRVTRVTATNTIIAGCETGVLSDQNAIVKLTNCTLDNNTIAILRHRGTLEINNTIISNSIDAGIDNRFGGSFSLRYSNVWSPSGVNYRNMGALTGQDGNLSVEPGYQVASNYRLDPTSPMIDAADGTVAPVRDFRGELRYDSPQINNTGLPTATGNYADIGAFEFVDVAPPEEIRSLSLGTPTTGTLGQDQAIYYQIQVQAGKTLRLTFDSSSDAAVNELYVSYGKLPTRSEFDIAFSKALSPDQTITIPATQVGTYYILAYGDTVASQPANYTIEAQALESLTVFDTTYGRGGTAGQLTLEINGAEFDRTVTAHLKGEAGVELPAKSYYYVNPTKLYATFDLTGITPGLYDVAVGNGQGSQAVVTDGLEVVAGGGGMADIQLEAPPRVGRNRQLQLTVKWSNDGINDVSAPLINVGNTAPIGFIPGIEATQKQLVFFGTSSGDGPPAILRPGQSETVTLFGLSGTEDGEYTAFVDHLLDDLNRPFDWAAIRLQLVPEGMTEQDFEPIFNQLVTQVGNTWADYLQMLSRNANLLPEQLCDNRNLACLLKPELMKAQATLGTSIQGIAWTTDLGIALSGRSILANNLDTGESFGTFTLNDGSFIFEEVTPGTYEFSLDGVLIATGNSAAVAEGQALTGVQLTLEKGGEISGWVRSEGSQENVAGASLVAIAEDGQTYSAATNESGHYLLEALPLGNYTLMVQAEGKAQQVTTVTVAEGGQVQNIVLSPEAVILGTVNLQGNSNSEGILSIFAQPSGTADLFNVFAADVENSSFTLRGLPAGTYDITISQDGYVTKVLNQVAASSQQTLDLGTVDLMAAAQISGVVTPVGVDIPAESIYVGLFDSSTQVAITSVETDGSFTFTNVTPGTYQLRAIDLTLGFTTEADVTVSSGDLLADVALEILPGATVTGTVRDENTTAILSGIPVIAIAPDGTAFSTITDANGVYRFEGLGLGNYQITLPITGTNATTSVAISSLQGDTLTADLTVSPAVARLGGQLLNANGEPIAGASVRLLEAGEFIIGTVTDVDGRYNFRLSRAGTFELQASADGASFAPVTGIGINAGDTIEQNLTAGNASLALNITDGMGTVEGATVSLFHKVGDETVLAGSTTIGTDGAATFGNLVAGDYEIAVLGNDNRGTRSLLTISDGTTTNLTLAVEQQYKLTGTVKDGNGNPIPSALIFVMDRNDPSIQFVWGTGSDGAYEIPYIPSGNYDLVVVANGYNTLVQNNVGVSGPTTANITLSDSTTTLSGHLIDPSGRAILFATVSVENDRGYQLGQASVNPDGSFSLTGVIGDNLILKTNALGFSNEQVGNLTIPDGTNLELGDLTIEPIALSQIGTLATGSDFSTSSDLLLAESDSLGLETMLAAALPPGGPSKIPNWFETQFSTFPRRQDELQESSVPLPANEQCKAAYQRARAAIFEQQKAYIVVQQSEKPLDFWAPQVPALFFRELTKQADTLFSLVTGVSSILKWLSKKFAWTITTLGGGETLRWVIADSATIIYDLGKGLKDLFDSSIKTFKNLKDDFAEPEELKFSLNQQKEASLNLSKTMAKVTPYLAKIKGIALNALQEAELKGGAGGIKVLAIFSNLANIDSTLKSAFQYGETNAALDQVIDARVAFESAIHEYDQTIARAYKLNERYQQCLKDAENKEKESLPDEPDEPPDDEEEIDRPVSWDPNDIAGPRGYGAEGWLVPTAPFNYMIRFENDPTLAQAPAQTVRITQTLDPDLDFSSFRLGDFGFGKVFVDVPSDRASYETSLDLTNTLGILVDVEVKFNPSTGEISWKFTSIDPNTGELPEDPLIGLLPPNQQSPNGEGFVTYAIEPKSTLVTGDAIDAQATIVFDFNQPIETPAIVNTIDRDAPASNILPLTETTDNPNFTVSWAGVDSGSGITDYDVYVSVDGSPFTLWLNDTTDTSATYNGEVGKTYAFYSVARDNVGNLEAIPIIADTQTTVAAINNPPVTEADKTLTVDEDAAPTSLNIAAPTDADNDPLIVTVNILPDPTKGKVQLANGTDLAVNQPLSITDLTGLIFVPLSNANGAAGTFSYTVSDGKGGTDSQIVTLEIAPVNDPATISGTATATVTEDTNVDGNGKLNATGTLTVSDVDAGEDKFNTTVTGTTDNLGSLTITENGVFNYSVDNSAVQSLGQDLTKINTFTVRSFDGTASQDITVTITGVNDSATITGTATATVTEDINVDGNGKLNATGTLTVSDVDAGEDKFNITLTSATDNLGSLTITENGVFNYSVDNSAVQSLGQDLTKIDTFTVQSFDGTASQEIAITIAGVNDAPTLQQAIADQNATANQSFNFTFNADTFSDVDAGDTLTYNATLENGDPLPTWLSFNAATRTFSGTPTTSDTGSINIQVTAKDGQNATAVDVFSITVAVSNVINGDDTDNILSGTPGDDIINGFAGNDYITGLAGNDTIDGGTGKFDRMFGGSGNDSITDPDGVLGAHGGIGNDTINVTFISTWDNDTNPTNAPRSDGKITGGYGDDNITVTMNNSKFFINLKGDEPTNSSQDGNDVVTLLGRYQNAVIDLGGGNDTFNGGSGSDNISGKAGKDILLGNGGNDQLAGNDGNDTLVGGAGNDKLTGGCGQDNFSFSSLNEKIDSITDFKSVDDTISVDDTGFGGGLAVGTLLETQFVLGTAAADEIDRFIYNQCTGALFFDVDGTGATAKIQIATLTNKPVISFEDIVVI